MTDTSTGQSKEKPSIGTRQKIAVLLGGLALLGPLSIDAYLPAFPYIERDLSVGSNALQLTLTAYLFAFAVMSLWHGAISDAYGRRPVIVISLIVFAAASLGCALAPDLEWLLTFRVLQGLSAGAGTVVGRAVIRDLYEGAMAIQMLALVSMIFSISPAIAPILAGWIVTAIGWRAVFFSLLSYSVILTGLCTLWLRETLPPEKRRPLRVKRLFSEYAKVLGSRSFQCNSGAVASNFAGLFLYVSAAPVLLRNHLHLTSKGFAWEFVPLVTGTFFGSLVAERTARKLSQRAQTVSGFSIAFIASLANVVFHSLHAAVVPWTLLPLLAYSFGTSLAAPGITLTVLNLYPDFRGIVASCQSFVVVLIASVVSGVAAPMLDSSVLMLALGQFGFGCLGLALWIAGQRNETVV